MTGQPNPTVPHKRVQYGSYSLLAQLWDRVITNKPPPPPRAVFTKCSTLWPCSKDKPLELTYSFFKLGDNTIQSKREKKIDAVLERIQRKVPGVKFIPEKKVSDATIRIAFNPQDSKGRTWSQVGIHAAGINSDEPTMNLSEVTGHGSGEIEENSNEYADIIHEFFHTLGMHHEHQHPERKFSISRTVVVKDMRLDNGWTEKETSDNTRKLRPDEVGPYSPLDGTSIMMYRIPQEWTNDGSEFQRNKKPSDTDWAWLNLVYPPCERAEFEEALSKSGINLNEEHKELILKLYSDGEWERVRAQLTRASNLSSNKSIVERVLELVSR